MSQQQASSTKNSAFSFFTVVLALVLTVIATFLYAAIWLVVPTFEELLANVGAELPALTMLFIDIHRAFIILSLLGMLPSGIIFSMRNTYFKHQNLALALVIFNFILSLLIFTLTIYLMYLPVIAVAGVS